MDELNAKARALIDAGRVGLRATDEDRERIEAALRVKLGAAALPLQPGVAHAARSAGLRLVSKLVIGAGLVGGVALFAAQPSADTSRPKAAHSAAPAPETSREIAATPPAPSASTHAVSNADAPATTASVTKRAGAAASHGPDRLAQEVALLSRATAALRAGHAAQALKALDEHQRRFPSGALSEDRRAAKAQALCLSGQVAKGRAELALLPPQSPAAARAEQVCAAGSLATPTQ